MRLIQFSFWASLCRKCPGLLLQVEWTRLGASLEFKINHKCRLSRQIKLVQPQ